MADEYGSLEPYGTYGDKNDPSPYDLLMQMKAWNKEIYFTIENMDKEVRTALQVLDGEIRAEILDVQGGLQTQITANAEGVASKVSKTDYNGNTVASLIAQSATAITAMAQALNLSGYVTFSSLTASGTTVIDGSRIQTGYISADRIQASTVLAKLIAAGGISADLITAGTISGDRISGGTITGVGISGYGINGTQLSASEGISTPNIDMTSYYGMIQWPDGARIEKNGSALSIYAPGGVSIAGYDIASFATTNTYGLGFGYSSTSNRLYVRLSGVDIGFVNLS